ncbi:MAG: ABC transporter permease [Planctomycetota bacterium]|nr:ABC transporter permease [Planctomycetota bacterium]
MTRQSGFWSDSLARLRRGRGARVGVVWVGLLLACAGLAPWVANEHPLRVAQADTTWWPVLEAYTSQDVGWTGTLLACLTWVGLARLGRARAARTAALVILGATVVIASRVEPVNLAPNDWSELAERGGTSLTWAPIRYGPQEIDKDAMLVRPGVSGHPLGTDANGRDVTARLLHGARTSLLVGLVAAGTATLLGLVIGALAGWYRGRVDVLLSWGVQVVACFPTIVLVITVCAFARPSLVLVMLLIGLTGWTETARLVRGEVMRLRELAFVESARALGTPGIRILVRHVLPHAMGPVTVQAALGVAGAVMLESALAFLGLGPADTPSWGRMLQEGRDAQGSGGHLVLLSGLLVFFTICAWNMVGEALREATDPQGEDVL